MMNKHKQAFACLEVLNGELSGHLFPLGEENIIGRKDENISPAADQINLPDTRVSRCHARIFFQKGRFYLEDLGSTNGTYLNVFRLQANEPCILREGSNVQVGKIHMRFRPALSNSKVKNATPWKSEIGFNEEAFDLALSATPDSQDSQDLALQGKVSMILRSPDLPAPEVSAVLNASEVIEALDASKEKDKPGSHQELKQLRAMTQISARLGAEMNQSDLLTKIMDFIFEAFPTAERAFIVLWDAKSSEFLPTVASTRAPNKDSEILALSEVIADEVISQRCSILSTDTLKDQKINDDEPVLSLNSRSVMCVPLLLEDEVMGIIQVDTQNQTHPFEQENLQILTGIGAQVAIALKNFHLYNDIEKLFDGFVTALVHAIEARDPTTAGHSFRVAEYAHRLATAVNQSNQPQLLDITFSKEQMCELRYAALLHDFGKIGVREHVLVKAKKFHCSQIDLLQERFKYAQASIERQAYRKLIDQHAELSPEEFNTKRAIMDKSLAKESQRLQNFLALVKNANESSVVDDILIENLHTDIFNFPGENGEAIELLTVPELENLTLKHGNLTPEEHVEMKSHVNYTFAFLNHIPWTGTLASVADIAHRHHEKLDGSGYPSGLMGDAIPIQSKIMAVADIFDTLTANDQSCQSGLDVKAALDILIDEAKQGKIDPVLVDVFIDSGAYQLFNIH